MIFLVDVIARLSKFQAPDGKQWLFLRLFADRRKKEELRWGGAGINWVPRCQATNLWLAYSTLCPCANRLEERLGQALGGTST